MMTDIPLFQPVKHLPRRRPPAAQLALVVLLAVFMAYLVLTGPHELASVQRYYLPWHSLMEAFAVVVAAMIFSIGWHSFEGAVPRSVATLSPVFLAVALLDFGHLMSVRGMPGVDGSDGDIETGIRFWLAARALGAVALLLVAVLPFGGTARAGTRRASLALSLALAGLCYWLLLRRPELVPPTYIEGIGLTPFKIWCELAVMATCALAAVLLAVRAVRAPTLAAWHLATAAAVLAISAVGFTRYAKVDDVVNLSGHVCKVVAYLFLYRAIYVTAVRDPYLRLRASERSLAESEGKFRSLMECAPDAIVLSDGGGRIAMMNACAEGLFGLQRTAAAGLPLDALVPRAVPDGDDVTCLRVGGEPFPAEVRRASLPGGAGTQSVAIVRDLSERRRLEKALLEQLAHDALTGLPNRGRILETLAGAMAQARLKGHVLAVLVLDLDGFKRINDGFGYAEGDAVLRECASRIERELRAGDTLARQGGNEFIVVQKTAGSVREVAALAEALLARMRAPFEVRGQQVVLSASIGVTLMPDEPVQAQDLVHDAQVAMGAARRDGAGLYRFHTAEMERSVRERMSLEACLSLALERKELALQYQPRVGLVEGGVVGVEALVRWRHPTLGLVPPGRFIPVAEESGMIEAIDMWVLREACAQAAAWQAEGLPAVRVSVNLSARQFQQAGLARRVRSVLEETGLAPRHLELEITEGMVMRDIEAAQAVLRSLKDIGVALAIDDFGTGYSSLAYLKRFPIDVIKIDRSFITDVTADASDAAITRAIIALAQGLGLVSVAEGVETEGQLAFLRANGCDEIQGYYFSRPLWPDALREMLVGEGADA